MIDTTISSYTTRHAGALVLAVAAAIGLIWASSGSQARPGGQNTGTATPIIGIARVLDGDTIVVSGVRIRLEGIDAPESSQTCQLPDGRPWACGHRATFELNRLIGAKLVTCDDRGPDKYGRTLGVCFAGSVELNAEMVRRGMAWAFVRYSQRYVAHEATARQARVGIWQGPSQPAWDFRADRWQTAEPGAPSGCAIKGNVTNTDRIYHMPWSPWYHKVNMNGGRGKRWFCSEGEAQAAGWRPAIMQ